MPADPDIFQTTKLLVIEQYRVCESPWQRRPDFTLKSTARKQVTLSETLDRGLTVIILLWAAWCSFCAEQLSTSSHVSCDLWYNHDTDILPVSSDSIGDLVERRDRYDLRILYRLLPAPKAAGIRLDSLLEFPSVILNRAGLKQQGGQHSTTVTE